MQVPIWNSLESHCGGPFHRNTLADLRWKDMIVDINAMQDRYEGGAMREQKAIDRAALEFYDNDPPK